MGCAWEISSTLTLIGNGTVNGEWLQEIRPNYLRHSFPISITFSNWSNPIFTGLLDMPHWRPIYIRVSGDNETLKSNAELIREAGKFDLQKSKWPAILLNRDSEKSLDKLINGESILDESRFLFIYSLERLSFPLAQACEREYIGPPVPDLSLRDVLWDQYPSEDVTRADEGKVASFAQSPVVTAIIDTEIAIANERFRYYDSKKQKPATRIAHFWRQQQEMIAPATGVATGIFFDKAAIDTLLSESAGDERDFYLRLRRGDHGQRGHMPLETLSEPDIMEAWKLEIAYRLKHMIQLEARSRQSEATMDDGDDARNNVDEAAAADGQYIHSGQLVNFITYPDGADSPVVLEGEQRRDIKRFVLQNTPDCIAKSITLLDPYDADKSCGADELQFLRDANYAARGRSRPVGFRAGHGTHIMDIAAGVPQESATKDTRPIVAVELPDYVVEDTSGARLEVFCLMAMRQVLDWVDDWGATTPGKGSRVPVVVNISLGNTAGPRDGTGFLEKELTRLAAAREAPSGNQLGVATKIVIAAGNGYRARLAGTMQLGAQQKDRIDWRVPPGDKSASYLEIRTNNPAELEMTLEEPGGETVTLTPGAGACLRCDNQVVGRLYRRKDAHDDVMTLALAPTLALDAPYFAAPAGAYRLTLKNTGTGMMNINLGIQRDETLTGYPLYGKQSYLDHPTVDERDHVTGKHDLPETKSPVGRENVNRHAKLTPYRRPKLTPLCVVEIRA